MSFTYANKENIGLENAIFSQCVCYQCTCELKLKDCVYWEQMDCVEINTDASNGQNNLEPKPLGLGLAHFVSNVIHIRNKYDLSNTLVKCWYLKSMSSWKLQFFMLFFFVWRECSINYQAGNSWKHMTYEL